MGGIPPGPGTAVRVGAILAEYQPKPTHLDPMPAQPHFFQDLDFSHSCISQEIINRGRLSQMACVLDAATHSIGRSSELNSE